MNAARYFRRYFSSNRLKNIYSDKIKYRATVGMDRITPAAFENKLDENVRLISQKVLSGKYKFTCYREVLISKGRGKEPRVISNILADIYLSDFKERVCSSYNVCFYRYVDDILILCNSSEAGEIKNFCVETLKTDYILDANEKKTMFGEIVNGVPFLGYMFFDSKVGIRPSAEEKLEDSIEELFRLRKKQTISPQVFIWRLNLRITGCILDSQKYGWLFYYSQLTDLSILFHLDWFVGHLFSRYGFDRPKDIKRFIRSYHEITKNISRSSYIINADRYSFEEKAEILSEIYNQRNFNKNDARTVDSLFKATMFKEVQRLEYDIQNFS